MRSGTRGSAALLCGALTLAWAAPAWANEPARPPVQRPSVVGEPSPTPAEPMPAEPELTPAVTPSAEPSPSVEPSPRPSDGVLPHYSDVELAQPLGWDDVADPIVREVPRDGRGRLVVGSAAVVASGLLMAGSITLAVEGQEPVLWASPMVLSAGGVIIGGLLLNSGRRRLRAYREWESAQPDVVPAQGHALVGAGAVLLIGGATAGVSGTAMWAVNSFGFHEQDWRVPSYIPAMVGVGVGSLAIGTVSMIVGMKRHKRFQAWRTQPQLVPGISPLAGGVQIGLSGRF